VAYLARRAQEYGVRVGTVAVDMAGVRARKEEVVRSFRDGIQKGLEDTANLSSSADAPLSWDRTPLPWH
jgi:hypothetical protein